jgi:hypothetical protein
VTYTVTDELAVEPMSNISSIGLLRRLGVEDLGTLEKRTVKIGYQEVIYAAWLNTFKKNYYLANPVEVYRTLNFFVNFYHASGI